MGEVVKSNEIGPAERYLVERRGFLEFLGEWRGDCEKLMVAHGGALATTYAFISQSSLLSLPIASFLIRGFSFGLIMSILAFVLGKLASQNISPLRRMRLRILTISMTVMVAISAMLFMALVGLAALLMAEARPS